MYSEFSSWNNSDIVFDFFLSNYRVYSNSNVVYKKKTFAEHHNFYYYYYYYYICYWSMQLFQGKTRVDLLYFINFNLPSKANILTLRCSSLYFSVNKSSDFKMYVK
jgi:hypothetical protein